jgi:Mor family transcriptional regulator
MDIIKYQGHKKRTEDAMTLWSRIVEDYNSGKSAAKIAKETRRTKAHIYWVLKRVAKLKRENKL